MTNDQCGFVLRDGASLPQFRSIERVTKLCFPAGKGAMGQAIRDDLVPPRDLGFFVESLPGRRHAPNPSRGKYGFTQGVEEPDEKHPYGWPYGQILR